VSELLLSSLGRCQVVNDQRINAKLLFPFCIIIHERLRGYDTRLI
jgi:hypothetical protein